MCKIPRVWRIWWTDGNIFALRCNKMGVLCVYIAENLKKH